jgi:hypothetical protein
MGAMFVGGVFIWMGMNWLVDFGKIGFGLDHFLVVGRRG